MSKLAGENRTRMQAAVARRLAQFGPDYVIRCLLAIIFAGVDERDLAAWITDWEREA